MAKNYQKAVNEYRKKIQDARSEREALATAPLPTEEVTARVDAWIHQKAEQAQRRFKIIGNALARPGGRVEAGVDPFRVFALGGANAIDLGPIMCAMFPDQVRAMVMAGVDLDPDALPINERPAHLAAIDQQILELEMAEEDAIREAEAAGVYIERRPDASPDAILRPAWPETAEA